MLDLARTSRVDSYDGPAMGSSFLFPLFHGLLPIRDDSRWEEGEAVGLDNWSVEGREGRKADEGDVGWVVVVVVIDGVL